MCLWESSSFRKKFAMGLVDVVEVFSDYPLVNADEWQDRTDRLLRV